MPYIFYHGEHCFFIDATPKNGVYCKIFSNMRLLKTLSIQSRYTPFYHAYMTPSGKLYSVTLNDNCTINYFTLEHSRFIKNTFLSSDTAHYKLYHPMIYELQNTLYISYLSYSIAQGTYSFILDTLSHSKLITLVTLYTEPKNIKCYCLPKGTYIFYILPEDTSSLYILSLENDYAQASKLIECDYPIIDYTPCITASTIHIAYTIEFHGTYQLFYTNTELHKSTFIITTAILNAPILFYYFDCLWINMLVQNKLYMFISVNEGVSFSESTPCSLQANLCRVHFISAKASSLIAHELYISFTPLPKLCTLAMIDFEGIFISSPIPVELSLLLKALKTENYTLKKTLLSKEDLPLAKPNHLIKEPKESKETISSPPPSPPKPPSIQKAKNHFISDDFNHWDLPPKI